MLQHAARSPRLAAQLTANGVLERELQNAAGQETLLAAGAVLRSLAAAAEGVSVPDVRAASLRSLAGQLEAAAEAPDGRPPVLEAAGGLLPPARTAAAALLQLWDQQADADVEQLALAQAAAARPCAYLLCANLAAEGGTAGTKRCR